jgi:hypothetical protein
VAGFALFGSAFAIPAFGLQVLSLTPTHAGLLLLPSGLLVGLGLLTAGSLIQIKGVAPFKLVPIGILCFMTAMWMLSHSTIDSGAPDMTPALLLRGLGLGFLFVSLTMVALVGPKGPLNPQGIALFNFGRQFGGLIGIAFLLTYLDHQLALNRSVLSINLTPGNPWLAERQAAAAEFLTSRGYNPDEAMGTAVAVIQGQVSQQVTVLSFNEVFLAVALLFVVAAPVLIVTRLLLKRLLGATAQRTDPYVRRHEKVARSSSNRRLYSPRLTTSARDANPDRDRLPILTSIRSGSRAAKPRFLTVRFRQQHQAPGTTELGAIWPRAEGQLRSRRSSKAALCLASSGRLIRRSAHPIAL